MTTTETKPRRRPVRPSSPAPTLTLEFDLPPALVPKAAAPRAAKAARAVASPAVPPVKPAKPALSKAIKPAVIAPLNVPKPVRAVAKVPLAVKPTLPAPKPAHVMAKAAVVAKPVPPVTVPKPVRPAAKAASTIKPALPVVKPAPSAVKAVRVLKSPIQTKTAKPAVKANKAPAKPAAETVRVIAEVEVGDGRLWKMCGRHGVAYVRDAALAGALLAVEPKRLPLHAMAVYYDKKGKAFAWQVRFDTERWEEVMRRLA